jgi:5S rRNA maturation endonuclease (ribonuclease M5)
VADSVYTLLIVESPVIAGILQSVSPQSVYVMATGGYCWHPSFKQSSRKLTAIADPEKRSFRKELKEQSQWANRIIIATDSDPSGDFIAWSIAKHLKPRPLLRGYLKSLSKNGVRRLLDDVYELQTEQLEERLKNRFTLLDLWNQQNHLPDIQLAGIASLFGTQHNFTHFKDNGADRRIYRSSEPIAGYFDELFTFKKEPDKKNWRIDHPPSTFDVVEHAYTQSFATGFRDAQSLLQTLFETVLPHSGSSLISYPRTTANGFYSESWEAIRQQSIRLTNEIRFKPTFLQNSIDPESPHESIHPLRLSATPETVAGEIHSRLGNLYEWIYNQTLKSIQIPGQLNISFSSELNPGLYLYPLSQESENHSKQITVHPVFTISDFGKALNRLGVCKPSDFGSKMDEWIYKKWIRMDHGVVKPGATLKKHLNRAATYKSILTALNEHQKSGSFSVETVRHILTSD